MSNQQQTYHYHYLTVTGEGDAHQLVKDYHLSRADARNKGEVIEDRYEQQQMCIRLSEHQDDNLLWDEAIERFLESPHQRRLLLLPEQFELTLHLVVHGMGYQGYGFHLNESNIRQLARLRASFRYHACQQADDGHDFPYSRVLPEAEEERASSEYAYLIVESSVHSLAQLVEITGWQPAKRSFDRGEIQFPDKPPVDGQLPQRRPTTRFRIDSGVEKGRPLPEHIAPLLTKLEANYEWLTPLLLDYRVSFALVGTGSFVMPHQLVLPKEWLQVLARFRCSVDMDLYAQ